MPSETPKGYPYPVPSDPVSSGDEAMENLATFLNNYITGGQAIVPVAASSTGFLDVEFPADYLEGAPIVVATAASPNYICGITNLTANGFRLTVQERAAQQATVNVACYWIAIPD